MVRLLLEVPLRGVKSKKRYDGEKSKIQRKEGGAKSNSPEGKGEGSRTVTQRYKGKRRDCHS